MNYIVGRGGLACEFETYFGSQYGRRVKFLEIHNTDSGKYDCRVFNNRYEAYDDGQEYKPDPKDTFLFGTGSKKIKKIWFAALSEWFTPSEKHYPNRFAPGVILPPNIEFGYGNVIAHAIVTGDNKFGNFNFVNNGSFIAHNVEMGDYNFFGPSVQVCGWCTFGSDNWIGVGTNFYESIKVGNNNTIAGGSLIREAVSNDNFINHADDHPKLVIKNKGRR